MVRKCFNGCKNFRNLQFVDNLERLSGIFEIAISYQRYPDWAFLGHLGMGVGGGKEVPAVNIVGSFRFATATKSGASTRFFALNICYQTFYRPFFCIRTTAL